MTRLSRRRIAASRSPFVRRPALGLIVLFAFFAILIAGCAGKSGSTVPGAASTGNNEPGNSRLTLGAFTAGIALPGASQDPVVSTTANVAVTGIAGGSFTSIVQNNSSESLTLRDTRIAFVGPDANGVNQIFTAPYSGGAPTQLTTGTDAKSFPAWHPLGNRIAYSGTNARGVLTIFTVPSVGGTPTEIATGHGNIFVGGYSPDGNKLVYIAPDSTGVSQLFTVPATGGNSAQVTTGPAHKFHAAWSPDGKWFAYDAADGNGHSQIFLLPVGGGPTLQVTSGQSASTSPAWSPDSTRIAFSGSDSASHPQIFVVPITGGNPTPLTAGPAFKGFPTWSPDGKWIAYCAPDAGNVSQILAVPATGGAPVSLTAAFPAKTHSAWSPFQNVSIVMVGNSGRLGTGAAGFLFAQDGEGVRSFLAFDTGDSTLDSRMRSHVDNVTPISASSPSLIFHITARDSLSRLIYSNYDATGQPGRPLSVFLATGVSGALIGFNATTGIVETVLPYAASRSIGSSAPQIRRAENAFVVTGHFVGIYDASGNNRAVRGARTVRLDARTGKLLSAE